MTDPTPAPGPVPPAAQSPFPTHPAPKAHGEAPLPKKPAPKPTVVPGIGGGLGLTLLGGALAAAVGVFVVRPLLKRKAKPAPKRRAPTRRKRTVEK